MIASVDPATGLTVKTFEEADAAAVDRALARAATAFATNRARLHAERAGWLRRAGELLLAEKEQHARTMALEMGKVLKGGIAEIEKCAWACRWVAMLGRDKIAHWVVVDGVEGVS